MLSALVTTTCGDTVETLSTRLFINAKKSFASAKLSQANPSACSIGTGRQSSWVGFARRRKPSHAAELPGPQPRRNSLHKSTSTSPAFAARYLLWTPRHCQPTYRQRQTSSDSQPLRHVDTTAPDQGSQRTRTRPHPQHHPHTLRAWNQYTNARHSQLLPALRYCPESMEASHHHPSTPRRCPQLRWISSGPSPHFYPQQGLRDIHYTVDDERHGAVPGSNSVHFGNRRERSTTHYLVSLVQYIVDAAERGCHCKHPGCGLQ